MDNRRLISISCLIIALSIAYYFVIYMPKKEDARLELEKQKQSDLSASRVNLDECLAQAEANASDIWDRECNNQNKETGCNLPNSMASTINNYRLNWKEECFKKYPQD